MAPSFKNTYIFSISGGPFAFVPHPAARGLWVRTHPCVVLVDCGHCKAAVHELCHNGKGDVSSSTHWVRRLAAKDKLKALEHLQVLVVPQVKIKKG